MSALQESPSEAALELVDLVVELVLSAERGKAARCIDAVMHAEYMRGVMEASGCCMECGASKDEDCHCGEIDEVEL